MKIAVISNVRHRNGDLIEFLLLRAAHWFGAFDPVDLLIVTGELSAWGAPVEKSFLAEFETSLSLREVKLPILWLADRPRGTEKLPQPPETVRINGRDESPVALTERIRAAAGGLPDFEAAAHEAVVAEIGADDSIWWSRVGMALPDLPCVGDYHIHTNMAYCSENMSVPRALAVAGMSNLAGLCFSEHSGHLYFPIDEYWAGRCVWKQYGKPGGGGVTRMPGYCEAIASAPPGSWLNGFEVDVDAAGDVMLRDGDRALARLLLGAVHFLEERKDQKRAEQEFLFRTRALLRYGVPILAHPFRIFAWSGLRKSPDLYLPLIELLKQFGTAAEINFHRNEPEAEFFDLCVRHGVKLSLGSDAHNLYEVGFLLPHLRFLKELGVSGKLDTVLWQFPGK